ADLPYFLRAYFSFKMGLPFGYAKCTRGDGGQPPRCYSWWNIQKLEPPPPPPTPPGLPPEQQVASPAPAAPWGLFGQRVAASAPAPLAPIVAPAPPPRPKGLVPGFAQYLPRTLADRV